MSKHANTVGLSAREIRQVEAEERRQAFAARAEQVGYAAACTPDPRLAVAQ